MSTTSKTFKVVVSTTPNTFKVKAAMTLIKSQNVYKGPFETVDELDSVQALNGDYADVYETGTRWQYVTDTWTNTNKPIPVDKQYAQVKDVNVLPDRDTIVQRDTDGAVKTATPVADDDAATKKYVDDVDRAHQTRLQTLENELTDEVSRATTAEGVLADSIDEESARAKNAEAANAANILKNTTSIDSIKKLIPNTATENNKLADKDFVNSSIANNVSNYVTATPSGDSQFASLAALQAGPWYLHGESYIPTKNDYAIYINTDNSVWRAVYDGQVWVAAYKVNDTPFTAAQIAALNSGVTASLLANMTNEIANKVVMTALASVLYGTDANGNQITKAISEFATALQGQKADTAYQKPASGIPESDLTATIQSALTLARTANSYTDTKITELDNNKTKVTVQNNFVKELAFNSDPQTQIDNKTQIDLVWSGKISNTNGASITIPNYSNYKYLIVRVNVGGTYNALIVPTINEANSFVKKSESSPSIYYFDLVMNEGVLSWGQCGFYSSGDFTAQDRTNTGYFDIFEIRGIK